MAKAIYDNKLLDCFFTRSFYKHILGKPVHFTDLESFDYSFYQGLQYLLDHDLSDIGMELTFSTEVIGHAKLFCCLAAVLFFIGAVSGLAIHFVNNVSITPLFAMELMKKREETSIIVWTLLNYRVKTVCFRLQCF